MADVFATPNTGSPHRTRAHAPSPKPRNSLSASKLAAAYDKQTAGRPEPFPRKKSPDRGLEEKEGIPDYVNDPAAVEEIRSSGIAARRLASQHQHTSPHSTPTHSAVRHILQIGRNRSSSEGEGGSSDEEPREYINCAQGDRVQSRRTSEPVAVGRTNYQRQSVQQISVGTTDEETAGEAYVNCDRNFLANLEDLKDPEEADSYVQMNPPQSRKLYMASDLDNAYVKMNPAPRRPSSGSTQQHIYQVPTSNRPISSVDPQNVAGIYEIEPDANPLHPHHQMSVHPRMHSSGQLHDSPRISSLQERSSSSPHLTANRKGPRLPLTPPPRTRPPEPRPVSSSPLTTSPIASGRCIRSYSIDELASSNGRTVRAFGTNEGATSPSPLMSSPNTGRRDTRLQSLDQLSSSVPPMFSPPHQQPRRKGGPPLLMSNVSGFHGRLTRKLAEARLEAAGSTSIGDYIIRESTNAPPGKVQVVISLKTTSVPMHVIVDYRDGMFWMSASEKNQVSFRSMEDLLQHYNDYPIVVDGRGTKVKLCKPIHLRRASDN